MQELIPPKVLPVFLPIQELQEESFYKKRSRKYTRKPVVRKTVVSYLLSETQAEIEINTSGFAEGIYHYAFVVNDKTIATKSMTIIKN